MVISDSTNKSKDIGTSEFTLDGFFNSWLLARPEFDTKVLEKLRCWPVTNKHYFQFTIKKRNGTERNLVTVRKNLKEMQSKIAKYLEKKSAISKHAHAFIPKNTQNRPKFFFNNSHQNSDKRLRGVISNALPHSNKKVVISIDIKDFFGSITFSRVIGLLKSNPFNLSNNQAVVIASLVCLPKSIDSRRGLPQGAPSSPILSNLICGKIDYQLAKMARKYDIAYTRYADDLTFSTNNLKSITPNKIISLVEECIKRNGFTVNTDKTKVMFENQRQMVAGILVNEGLNLPKKQVDALRATLHNLEHNYKTIDEAIFGKGSNSHDSFVPLGYYSGGYRGRYIASINKGNKRHKPTSNKEFEWIYAQHLLGRIMWYGQVVTTGIQDPYGLTQRQLISPKQYSRIVKYEEFLGAFYRISLKFNWPIEHVILRRANKLPTLQSLVNMKPNLLLEPFLPDQYERELRLQASKLNTNKEKYTDFFEKSPRSLQRALRVLNRSHYHFSLDKIKKSVDTGWPDPIKQRKVFEELNTESLADLFHKSTNKDGHKVKTLLMLLVENVKPVLPYLSDNVSRKIVRVHQELLNLMRSQGESVCIDPENETVKTEQALQAIRELKSSIRLYEENSDDFHNKIVNQALKVSGTSRFVHVIPDGMAIRMVTDIAAWSNALTKVLISIKEHMDDSEKTIDKNQKPFTLKLRDEHPITGKPRAIEIYRRNKDLRFKKNVEISTSLNSGKVERWITGGDLSKAVKEFLPVGDIYVHSEFLNHSHLSVNITEHLFNESQPLLDSSIGKLYISLEEVKSY
jgi:hypothetical protein